MYWTITILILYLSTLILIGIISSKKSKTSKSFYLADRKISTLPLTATITATVVGGSATIATAKMIYLYGLPSLWLDIGATTGLIILGLTLAKIVRKTGLYTLPEITGHLFDNKVRYTAAILIILTQIAWISLLIQGAGAITAVLFPINYKINGRISIRRNPTRIVKRNCTFGRRIPTSRDYKIRVNGIRIHYSNI